MSINFALSIHALLLSPIFPVHVISFIDVLPGLFKNAVNGRILFLPFILYLISSSVITMAFGSLSLWISRRLFIFVQSKNGGRGRTRTLWYLGILEGLVNNLSSTFIVPEYTITSRIPLSHRSTYSANPLDLSSGSIFSILYL